MATLLTMKEKAMVDGLNEYGFPFRFYTFTNSKVIENIEQTGFDLIGFSLDIVITATLAFITAKSINKFYIGKQQ